MLVKIPYGHQTIDYEIARERVITSNIHLLKSDKDPNEIVKDALSNTIDSPSLSELAKDKKSCTIIISDHTRPVPSKYIIPHFLKELRTANPNIDITLLVATGFHRLTTREELLNKLGEDIVNKEKIFVHDANDINAHVKVGILPSGAPLLIDKRAINTDLLIAEGFVEPHFFAGYSGGRKSVLPGLCYKETVMGNHCGAFIANEKSCAGSLRDNPINIDMEAAAMMAKLQFILNVIIDENKRIVAAFAGHPIEAHHHACDYLQNYCEAKAVKGDIVITSNGGAPLDQNIYQCVKGLSTAMASTKENGKIIILAECRDGIGGDSFYRSLKNSNSAEELFEQYTNTPQDKTIADQWQTQIMANVLRRHQVIFITRIELKEIIEDMKMTYASSLKEALETAGPGEITVIPDGISVIIK